MMRPTDPTLFLERVDGETLKALARYRLLQKGHGQGRSGVVKFVVDLTVAFLSLQAKGSSGKRISPQTTTVQRNPSNITLNFAI